MEALLFGQFIQLDWSVAVQVVLLGVIGGVIEEWRRNLGVEVTVRQLEPQAFLYSLNQEKNDIFETGWEAEAVQT